MVICSKCNEDYIRETGKWKTMVRDKVRVYRQHIRQVQYQQLKCEEYFTAVSALHGMNILLISKIY